MDGPLQNFFQNGHQSFKFKSDYYSFFTFELICLFGCSRNLLLLKIQPPVNIVYIILNIVYISLQFINFPFSHRCIAYLSKICPFQLVSPTFMFTR